VFFFIRIMVKRAFNEPCCGIATPALPITARRGRGRIGAMQAGDRGWAIKLKTGARTGFFDLPQEHSSKSGVTCKREKFYLRVIRNAQNLRHLRRN